MDRYGLIGRKLGHSFSPQIHALIGDYEYKLYPLEPEELSDFVENTELSGFNVTIPYKRDVMGLCRRLSPQAQAIGSVNTMVRLPGGGFLGDNTDWDGFLRLLSEDGAAIKGKKALVLGSGGASLAVCAVLGHVGIPYVVVSRNGDNHYGNLDRHRDAALIINATPVGMAPNCGASPVDLRQFPACGLVLDLIYNPAQTALLQQARALSIPARNGLLMLAAQAVRAGELFTGQSFSPGLAQEIADKVEARTRNVTLIGMPGCGKTTVAQKLVALTGRLVLDTDELVRQAAGMEIPAIFAQYGEEHFRKLETQALRQAEGETGVIVAAGGGVVTRPENLPIIRQNGVCLLLERPLPTLAVDGRPLSGERGVQTLWRERESLYRAWSDKSYINAEPGKTALAIKEEWKL